MSAGFDIVLAALASLCLTLTALALALAMMDDASPAVRQKARPAFVGALVMVAVVALLMECLP